MEIYNRIDDIDAIIVKLDGTGDLFEGHAARQRRGAAKIATLEPRAKLAMRRALIETR